jgi:hypothetical protein
MKELPGLIRVNSGKKLVLFLAGSDGNHKMMRELNLQYAPVQIAASSTQKVKAFSLTFAALKGVKAI